MSGNDKKQKGTKIFFRIDLLDTYNTILTMMLEMLSEKADFFSLIVCNSWTNWTYRGKNFSLNWSNGHSYFSFNNAVGGICAEGQKFQLNVIKSDKRTWGFWKKTLYPWNVRTDMLNEIVTIFCKFFFFRPKKFRYMSKIDLKDRSLAKTVHPRVLWTRKMQFR